MQQEESGASHQTMVISRSDIALEQTYPASVEGRQSIRMIPRVEGYLAEIRIHEGQRVSKGQVQLESARSNLSYTELTSPSDGVVRLCTLSGVRHQLGMTLDEVESQLDPQRFMRVNRQKNAALGSFPNASFLPIWKYPGDRWQTWRSR